VPVLERARLAELLQPCKLVLVLPSPLDAVLLLRWPDLRLALARVPRLQVSPDSLDLVALASLVVEARLPALLVASPRPAVSPVPPARSLPASRPPEDLPLASTPRHDDKRLSRLAVLDCPRILAIPRLVGVGG
jgi:hypothetical protein